MIFIGFDKREEIIFHNYLLFPFQFLFILQCVFERREIMSKTDNYISHLLIYSPDDNNIKD